MALIVQPGILSSAFTYGCRPMAGSVLSGSGFALAGSRIALGASLFSNNRSLNLLAAAPAERELSRSPAAIFAHADAVAAMALVSAEIARAFTSEETLPAVSTLVAKKTQHAPAAVAAVAVPSASEEPPDISDAKEEENISRGYEIIAGVGTDNKFDVDFTINGGISDLFSFDGASSSSTPEISMTEARPAMHAERIESPALVEAIDASSSRTPERPKALGAWFPGIDGLSGCGLGWRLESDSQTAVVANGIIRSAQTAIRLESEGARSVVPRGLIAEIARLVSIKSLHTEILSLGEVASARSMVVERETEDGAIKAHFVSHEARPVFAGWERAEDRAEERAFAAQPGTDAERLSVGKIARDGMAVMGLGQPGGESSFGKDPLVIDDPEVVERLTGLILAQLRQGPASLEKGEMLAQFNAFVRARLSNGSSAPHTPEQWDLYLHEALSSAVRFAMPFDEHGARPIAEIESQATRILGMDLRRLSEWEGYFNAEFVSARLFETTASLAARFEQSSPKARLAAAFSRNIESMAKGVAGSNPDHSVSFADEAGLQWSMATAAMVAGLSAKADYTARIVSELRLAGRRGMASRALAIVFRASEASESGVRADGIVPRWSEAELAAIIKRLMNDKTWDVASHRSFRMHLTPAENSFVNRLVEAANLQNVVDVIRSIDLSSESTDRVWDAIDASGQGEAIIDNVINRMSYMISPAIVDASLSEDIN